MKRKTQRVFAVIIAIFISIAMIGSTLAGYFVGSGVPSSDSSASMRTANAAADYQEQKSLIDVMVKQTQVDTENVPLQTALGNAYYQAGIIAQEVAPTEMQENFRKAVEAYQVVLKTNKDPNIMVDMATSAFYSGNNELAEKSYIEVLALKPDFFKALSNYGYFLSQAKQDWTGALNQWQKALPLAKDSSEKEWINLRISQAQSALEANSPTNGLSNPDQALNSEVANPATPGQ